MSPTKEQIAHDLAIAYINNRYGAEITGDFSVTSFNNDVTGSGTVETKRFPPTNKVRTVRVPTGERAFFGLIKSTESVAAGYEVDGVFKDMIEDYYSAYARFLALLEDR